MGLLLGRIRWVPAGTCVAGSGKEDVTWGLSILAITIPVSVSEIECGWGRGR